MFGAGTTASGIDPGLLAAIGTNGMLPTHPMSVSNWLKVFPSLVPPHTPYKALHHRGPRRGASGLSPYKANILGQEGDLSGPFLLHCIHVMSMSVQRTYLLTM